MTAPLTVTPHRFLDQRDCRAVHEGSCRLLEEVGVAVEHERAVELLRTGGARYEQGRVMIPRQMVEEAVERTAGQMTLKAARPEQTLRIDAGRPEVRFGTGGQALSVLHYENGGFSKKPAVTADLVEIVRLCDRLERCDFITRPVEPDVPEELMDLEKARIFLEHTTKHINLANLIRVENLDTILEMVEDPERISFICCLIVSPLTWADETAGKLIHLVERNLAAAVSSCPQAGTTAPLSEVGELIQVNAEVLSGVVLADRVRPGAKILYRGIPITSNLQSDLSPRWCQPEAIRRVAMATDLAAHYGIPCCGTAAVSDESGPTAHAICEKALSWTFEAAGGAQYINSALGMLEQVMTVCPVQYLIDDAVIGRVRELLEDAPDPATAAREAARWALETHGVKVTPEMEEEIGRRIDFITAPQETFDPEQVTKQVDQIGAAVRSGRSGAKFMRTSRTGLRQGWLYEGQRIEGKLQLKEVIEQKEKYLAEGQDASE
jgi:trimethylamine--corrinoid protein Co-methyltransferase